MLDTHDWPGGHATPHAPQWALLVLVSTQPAGGQKRWPVMPQVHIPLTHD